MRLRWVLQELEFTDEPLPDPYDRPRLTEGPDDIDDPDGELIEVEEGELERYDLPDVVERALRAEGSEEFRPDAGEEVATCPHCARNVQRSELRCWACARFLRKPTVREFRELAEGSGMGDPMASEAKKEIASRMMGASKIRSMGQNIGLILQSWGFWMIAAPFIAFGLWYIGVIPRQWVIRVVEFFWQVH